MTKREIVLTIAIAVAVIGIAALWFWRPTPISEPVAPTPVAQKPSALPPTPPAALAPPLPAPLSEYPQLSLKTMSMNEAQTIANRRLREDPAADWKVALNFYGKVVDENDQPVTGATVHYEWNTTWVPMSGGTAYADTFSDGAGLFSLTGQHGKILGVHIEKEGYYTDNGGHGDPSFEYANPSSPYWYEPDASNPVIFHLRRKGEGAKLFSKSLNIHSLDRVNLMQGFIKPDGVLTIATDFSKFLPGNQPFPWTASLSMAEGGLVETDDQFPFLAPTNGYTSTINFDMTNTDRSVWQDGVKKTYYFYLPSTNIYGRMTVTISSGLPVGLSYVYNLTPGNRILEPASK